MTEQSARSRLLSSVRGFTSFSEFNREVGGDIWFAFDESRPLAFFAEIPTRWTSVRKVREGETTNDVFGFLTTEPNAEVGPSTRPESYARHPAHARGGRHLAERADSRGSEAAAALAGWIAAIVARGTKKDGAETPI